MKQVILVRTDLKLSKGKACSQVAHASVEAVLKSDKQVIEEWQDQGMKKVILKVDSKEELLSFNKKAKALGLKTALIKDAGKTFFNKSTLTCLSIGPDKEGKIDRLTSNLKLLN